MSKKTTKSDGGCESLGGERRQREIISKEMIPTKRPITTTPASAGPVGIFWDMENCRIPSDVSPLDVAVNIRMALRLHPLIGGSVISFTAYGDFNEFPRRQREACQRTGVRLVDVPNTRKDASDKAILVDLFIFALDHSPPSTIFLISGDVDFANALHVLGQRGYTVIVAAPVNASVSLALRNAGHFLWDWPAVARGSTTCGTALDSAASAEEETKMVVLTQDEEKNSSHGFTIDDAQFPSSGNLGGSRSQVVRLLKEAGGSLPLAKLLPEYLKMYGKDGIQKQRKLNKLLAEMGDAVIIVGEGESRVVVLRQEEEACSSSRGASLNPSAMLVEDKVPLGKPGKKLKKKVVNLLKVAGGSLPLVKLKPEYEKMYGVKLSLEQYVVGNLSKQLEIMGDIVAVVGDGLSKEVVLLGNGEGSSVLLKNFRREMEELLVCYCGRILCSDFEEIYKNRYKRALDYRRFGVRGLEELVKKVGDRVMLTEQPWTGKKCIVFRALFQ